MLKICTDLERREVLEKLLLEEEAKLKRYGDEHNKKSADPAGANCARESDALCCNSRARSSVCARRAQHGGAPPPTSLRNRSAHVADALLSIHLNRGRRLGRQLKHRCRLTFAQKCQQHGPPIRKFERIVMSGRLVLC